MQTCFVLWTLSLGFRRVELDSPFGSRASDLPFDIFRPARLLPRPAVLTFALCRLTFDLTCSYSPYIYYGLEARFNALEFVSHAKRGYPISPHLLPAELPAELRPEPYPEQRGQLRPEQRDKLPDQLCPEDRHELLDEQLPLLPSVHREGLPGQLPDVLPGLDRGVPLPELPDAKSPMKKATRNDTENG